MRQFTVYRNKSPRTQSTFPFLVDVQSDLLEPLQTRVVIPITRVASLSQKPFSHLTPVVDFEGDSYLLMTPQLASVAMTELGTPAGSLAAQGNEIVAAMDFLLTAF
jgi:toxin CcdB